MKTRNMFKTLLSLSMVLVFLMSTLSISAYAEEEYDDIALGLLVDDMEIDYSGINYNLGDAVLPISVDLSTSKSFPCVRSQGRIGSCASWATTYYQFGYQVADMYGWDAKYDTGKQFSPKFTYNIVNEGNNKGSNMEQNYSILSTQGAVRYSEFAPYGIKILKQNTERGV